MNLSQMLSLNAKLYPEKTALIERGPEKGSRVTLTWREFDERVSKVASALRERGVKKGDRVMVWMYNSINWLEAYLGILRSGALAVPLNHRFTTREFKYCLHTAKPRLIFMEREFLSRVESLFEEVTPPQVILKGNEPTPGWTSFEHFVSAASVEENYPKINEEEPCSLYFTSGTTGAPKPIVLTHKNLTFAAHTGCHHGLRRKGDVFVILKPLYHTGDKIHWLSSLLLGETAVIQRGKITPRIIFEVMTEEKGTVAMLLVPWIQDTLMALERGELRKEDYDLSSWRLVLFGAQPVPTHLILRWEREFPQMDYAINYGLTEASGPGCLYLTKKDRKKLGSLGKPGYGWEVAIVDEEGKPLPEGMIGEIAVKGMGVMKGYFQNEEETRKVLKDGWLLTGDIGHRDEEGFVWLVDRKKDVIIYGGENIYPREIEEFIREHPWVYDVGVIGAKDGRLGEVAVAIVQLKEAYQREPQAEEEIRRHCEILPRYKRPEKIFFDCVPRNATGKIEKEKLREKYGRKGMVTFS